MIVTLGTEATPSVRVVLSSAELTAGSVWDLSASYSELGRTITYRPRGGSGVGAGAQVALVDFAAPIRTLVTYTLTRNGSVVSTGSATRTSPGDDVITDLTASAVAPFTRLRDGGDRRYTDRRSYASEVPGNPFPPRRQAPTAGAGGGQFSAETEAEATLAMRSIMRGNGLAYILHWCEAPDCDVPLVELVYITNDTSDRTGGFGPRVWDLAFALAADPEPNLIQAVSTWDGLDGSAKTWAALDAMALTWDAFDLTDWTTV